jgi:uncharacterized protein YkuJ
MKTNKKRRRFPIKTDESGSIFILTVCVFVFISIITINFTDITLSDTVRVKRNVNKAHAEIISLSGIELLKGYLLEHGDDFQTKVVDTTDAYEFPTTKNLLDGTVELDVKYFDDENNELTLAEVTDGSKLDYEKIENIELISKGS